MGLFGKRKQRKQELLIELEAVRVARRLADEDVTVLGEELSELHYDTLTTELQGEIADDYQKALDAYERAKRELRTTEGAVVVTALLPILEDGRFHLACVMARQEGRPLPQRLPSCFFNPQHGPSHSEVDWAPPGGEVKTVPVCLADRNRLERKLLPAVRMVRIGRQLVPWFEAEKAFALVDGKVDMRRFKDLAAYNHGQATLLGADPMLASMRYSGLAAFGGSYGGEGGDGGGGGGGGD